VFFSDAVFLRLICGRFVVVIYLTLLILLAFEHCFETAVLHQFYTSAPLKIAPLKMYEISDIPLIYLGQWTTYLIKHSVATSLMS
jgi:hypothetical protein